MVIKRKRSESELSISSTFSSPQRPDNGGFNFRAMMETNPPRAFSLSYLPSSRTMKRIRDNRPSEAEVHQHTLSLLYKAQQLPNKAQPTQSQPEVPSAEATYARSSTSHSGQQRSLHSFWNLPVSASGSATPSPSLSLPIAHQHVSTSCEDCGAILGGGGKMMLDVSGCGVEDHSCGACGKTVCFSCSISSLGELRRCLACAGRSVWVDGIGRTTSVGFC